jgi:hypothetical protein
MASTTASVCYYPRRVLLWYCYLITSHPDEEAQPEELVRGRNKVSSITAVEPSNERAKEASMQKILEHVVAKEGKDHELCDVTKMKHVLHGPARILALATLLLFLQLHLLL